MICMKGVIIVQIMAQGFSGDPRFEGVILITFNF